MNKEAGNIYKINGYCNLCRLLLALLFLSLGIFIYRQGLQGTIFWALVSIIAGFIFGIIYIKNINKNHQYVIDSINDVFYRPIKNEPVCKLSEIVDLNKRSYQRQVRESFYENGKQKHRNKTEITYYLDIVTTEGVITETLDKSTRDALHSLILKGIKDIQSSDSVYSQK